MAVHSPLIRVMARAAEKAGRALLRDFHEVDKLQVSQKGPGDFVTTSDKKSESIIQEELSRARPDFGFLMEEGGEVKGKDPDTRWVVDPLDGTLNFMHGIPLWVISIGLQRKKEIMAGVIYDPVRDELFWAEKGMGAYVNAHRLRVSARKNLGEALVSTGLSMKDKDNISVFTKEIEQVAPRVAAVRRPGSIALEMAYVAAGRYEAFWERNVKIWDIAAGCVIVTEAGGFVSEINGGSDYLSGNSILATNANLQKQIQKLLVT